MNTIQEVQDQATSALTIYAGRVQELGQIETSGQLAGAVAIRKAINDEIDTIKAGLKPHINNAKNSLEALRDTEKAALNPFRIALLTLNDKMLAYYKEEERKTEEKRRETARKQKEIDDKNRAIEEQKKKDEAKALWEKGEKERAREKLAEPVKRVPAPAAALVPEKKKVAGAGTATRWKAVLVDIKQVELRFLKFDQVTADAYATEHKDKAEAPGLRFEKKTYLSGK